MASVSNIVEQYHTFVFLSSSDSVLRDSMSTVKQMKFHMLLMLE
jgi:hypothetical protein